MFMDKAAPVANEAEGPLSARGLNAQTVKAVTLGEYRVLMKIANGATGAVYLARQRERERPVALKVLSRALAADPTYLQRFYREAEVLSQLRHPGIVALQGVGENSGLHFLVLEYVDGLSTSALLERSGGPMQVSDAATIVSAVAKALCYAHSCGVVHRDIKPPHIMISRRGEVKLTDLGLAKPMAGVSLTASGVGMGTPEYMPPEQARNAKHADERGDIYALGGVFYRLLTGHTPFQAENSVDLLLAKDKGRFPAASRVCHGVPRQVDAVLTGMLAKDPADRFPSCEELLGALEGLGLATKQLSFIPSSSAAENAPSPARH